MAETIDTILEVEEAIAELQAMIGDQPDPKIELEIRRLDDRLQQMERMQLVFVQPA